MLRTSRAQNEIEVKKNVEQILVILAYIHGEKLAHNDMKPENMLLFKDGRTRFRLKAGDWDSGCRFGEPRAKEATPCASSWRPPPRRNP